MPVFVVIDERAAGIPTQPVLQKPRLLGHVGEGSISVVPKQRILAVIADEQVVPPIVVIVPYATRLSPSGTSQPRFDCLVGKCSVSIVLEQVTDGLMPFRESLQS